MSTTTISAKMVADLRKKTGAGLMDCKKALSEAEGNTEQAIDWLRKKGIASASKRAERAANEGIIASFVDAKAKSGVLLELNCETDFVAKNDSFKALGRQIGERIVTENLDKPDDAVNEIVTQAIATIGENIILSNFARYQLQADQGIIADYIHGIGKVGVLVELTFTEEATAKSDALKQLAKDICMHIAASAPLYTCRQDVPEETIAKEKAIIAEGIKNKPAEIIEKIVEGKLNKVYSELCLLEQAFVKDPDLTIQKLIAQKNSELNDTVELKRFTRYQISK